MVLCDEFVRVENVTEFAYFEGLDVNSEGGILDNVISLFQDNFVCTWSNHVIKIVL